MLQYYTGARRNIILPLETEMASVVKDWVDGGCEDRGVQFADARNAQRAFLEAQYFSRV